MGLEVMAELAIGAHHRATGNRHPMAPPGIQVVLVLEIPKFEYYHSSRPHLSLNRNSPAPREVEPPCQGKVVSIPQVGGLHHRYSRAA